MKFSLIAAAALGLASSAFAAPAWGNCLAQSAAEDIVNQYITILSHPDISAANATAQALLADDYQEISDSILSLEGQPVSALLISCLITTNLLSAWRRYFPRQGRLH